MPHYRKVAVERSRQPPADPRHHGARCDECPLRGSIPIYDDGPVAPKLAIVGEAPGREEVEQGLPFIGRTGQYVSDLVRKRGLERKDVLLANAVACFPPGGDMKTFLQRSKKEHSEKLKESKRMAKLNGGMRDTSEWNSPIDCCRPRLFFSLGIPRCSVCGRWDISAGEYEDASALDDISCRCPKPKWVKTPFARPKAVFAGGNAALEALRGNDGITSKQMYRFENVERCK